MFLLQVLVGGAGHEEEASAGGRSEGAGHLDGVPGRGSSQLHQPGLPQLRAHQPQPEGPRAVQLRRRTGGTTQEDNQSPLVLNNSFIHNVIVINSYWWTSARAPAPWSDTRADISLLISISSGDWETRSHSGVCLVRLHRMLHRYQLMGLYCGPISRQWKREGLWEGMGGFGGWVGASSSLYVRLLSHSLSLTLSSLVLTSNPGPHLQADEEWQLCTLPALQPVPGPADGEEESTCVTLTHTCVPTGFGHGADFPRLSVDARTDSFSPRSICKKGVRHFSFIQPNCEKCEKWLKLAFQFVFQFPVVWFLR